MNSDYPLINLVDGFDEDEDTQRMTQREIAEALAVGGVRCKRGGENPLILAAMLRPQWPQQTGEDENVDRAAARNPEEAHHRRSARR